MVAFWSYRHQQQQQHHDGWYSANARFSRGKEPDDEGNGEVYGVDEGDGQSEPVLGQPVLTVYRLAPLTM